MSNYISQKCNADATNIITSLSVTLGVLLRDESDDLLRGLITTAYIAAFIFEKHTIIKSTIPLFSS